jgi:hypothetical protein
VSEPDAGSRLAAKAGARAYERRLAAGEETAAYHVGLAATFTAEALGPFLVHGLLAAGLKPALHLAPYSQVHQACLDHRAAFAAAARLDAIVLLWRIEDLLAGELEGFLAGDATALAAAVEKVRELGGGGGFAAAGLRGHGGGGHAAFSPLGH